jgi:hypothetical protein
MAMHNIIHHMAHEGFDKSQEKLGLHHLPTEHFTDFGKLNFPMVVQFLAQACPSCLQKQCSV